jgi:hypothetical protein
MSWVILIEKSVYNQRTTPSFENAKGSHWRAGL